ncbi:MAG: TetR/AcrR family transcriptional regulator C-terminal domain-containing protein [bacterium]|nr:TetR/AcrR family transcriptional regulator C-terminal domain-containing protein [bacterium]
MATKKRREPLTRERVVAAAMALADRDGLESLSMRALARELGIEAMSLYHHVKNREDLLDALVDAVYSEFRTPQIGAPWREEMEARAHSAREVILRHPWCITLMNNRGTPGLATVQHLDAVIGCLREGGLSLEVTAHAFALMDAYIYGFLIQEVALPFSEEEGASEVADWMERQLYFDTFPHIAGLARHHALAPDYAFGNEFGWGLTAVLDAIERAAE